MRAMTDQSKDAFLEGKSEDDESCSSTSSAEEGGGAGDDNDDDDEDQDEDEDVESKEEMTTEDLILEQLEHESDGASVARPPAVAQRQSLGDIIPGEEKGGDG